MSFTVNNIDVTVTDQGDDGVSFFWSTFVGTPPREFLHEVKYIDAGHVVTRFRTPPGGWSSYRVMNDDRWRTLRDREAAENEVKKYVAELP